MNYEPNQYEFKSNLLLRVNTLQIYVMDFNIIIIIIKKIDILFDLFNFYILFVLLLRRLSLQYSYNLLKKKNKKSLSILSFLIFIVKRGRCLDCILMYSCYSVYENRKTVDLIYSIC